MGRFLDRITSRRPGSGPEGSEQLPEPEQLQVQGKQVTLLDHSRGADPASLRAALQDAAHRLANQSPILVLGDMPGLGEAGPQVHADLLEPVMDAGPAAVYLLGPLMTNLWQYLPEEVKGAHLSTPRQVKAVLTTDLRDGDIVLLHASRPSGLARLARELRIESVRAGRTESWRMVVHGSRIHGVGYRRWLRQRAQEHGLSGWVRNRSDGTVEAVLSGQGPVLDAVIAQAHSGPRRARVRKVVTTRRKGSSGEFDGFELREDRQV